MRIQKNKATAAALAAVAVLSLFFASCSKKKSWGNDYDAALKSAQKLNKTVMLLFSADDWDGVSQQLKAEVFNTKEFKKEFSAQNVFLNIDFSQTEYGQTFTDENASEKEKKEAEKIAGAYKRKESLASFYNLQQHPSLYVLSKEGYVLQAIPYSEATNSYDAIKFALESGNEKRTSLLNLIQTVHNAEGNIAKAYAIDALYEATEPAYRTPLYGLVQEILTLDKENSTGLLGKYEMQNAYNKATEFLVQGNVKSAADVYIETAKIPHLSAEERQDAYYTASFILANSESQDYDRMLELLELAYKEAPESQYSTSIQDTISALQRLKERIQEPAGN